jgi:hypothetical protein
MRNAAATVVSCAALLLAAAAFGVATVAMNRPEPKPAPQQPLGVCVLLNPNFADTTVTATVEQATRANGVIACESGSYVPVTPK